MTPSIRFTSGHRRELAESRARTLAAVGTFATVGFALVALAVARRKALPTDEKTRRRATPPRQHPMRRAARAIAPVGKWHSYLGAALAIGGWLRMRGPRAGRTRHEYDAASLAIITSALSSVLLTKLFDRILPQPPTPPGHEDRTKPVFPSGHAFGPTAVGLTTAYTLARAALVHPGRAFLLALSVRVVTAGGRFLDERHWLSDIAGGLFGGASVAAFSSALHELQAVRRPA